MKKLVMILVSVFTLSSVAFSQERTRPSAEDMAKKQTERMAEKLSLTNDQKAKIETINLKYAKQHEASRNSQKSEKDAMRAEMKKVKEAKDAELKAVLTDEQYTKYQQDRPEKRDKGKGVHNPE
ncbi:MAG: DUF4890 domain-containing protein [Candidatus Azobacteroides sp.]|nr:DUF4890 domain-containing protein [Candidatus Azobacteroides sp.]